MARRELIYERSEIVDPEAVRKAIRFVMSPEFDRLGRQDRQDQPAPPDAEPSPPPPTP